MAGRGREPYYASSSHLQTRAVGDSENFSMTADSLTFVCHADSFPCFVVFKWCKAKQSALTWPVFVIELLLPP